MEIIDNAQNAVPVTILTGFLGAGKTTLLNRILNGSHGLRVAVLVNDFGAINIDTELIIGVEENAISLANGCVCCQIRDDLVDTIKEVITRPEQPEYILLEASGVADPSGIALTFAIPAFRDRIRRGPRTAPQLLAPRLVLRKRSQQPRLRRHALRRRRVLLELRRKRHPRGHPRVTCSA